MTPIIGTVELDRGFAAPPSAVFAAWASADALLEWSHPGDGWWMECDTFRLEVGHADVWRFGADGETPFVNVNRYEAVETDLRLVYATTLARDGVLNFAGVVHVEFEPASGGTLLRFRETGVYVTAAEVAGHEAGWAAMLDGLERRFAEQAAA